MSSQYLWKEEFNIGVDIIDEEHKRLFETINHLFLMTQKTGGWLGGLNGKRACRKGIEYFKEHALKHFADEEEYMAKIGYKGLELHKRMHKGFRENTLPALEHELEQTGYSPEAIEHFVGVCAGWLIGHSTTEDQAIAGKQGSLWEEILQGGELTAVKKAVIQLMYNIFHIQSEMISDAYNGEKFGKGIYYRLAYEAKQGGKRQEILLALEEKLLFSTVGEAMGIRSGRVSTALLHSARYTMQRFAGRIMGFLMKGEPCVLKEENLLSYDQFQEVFYKEKRVASLLFNTGVGYFACCVLTPDLTEDISLTSINHDNAMDEVAHYLENRLEQERRAPQKKILLVDDSETVRQRLNNLLSKDYEVSQVDSGVAAIRTITLNKPDLILLDYDMPVCNGRQTLELIRSDQASADIPVIFLTSRNDADSVKGVLALSPSGYLLKTMKPTDIKARVDDFFEKNKQTAN